MSVKGEGNCLVLRILGKGRHGHEIVYLPSHKLALDSKLDPCEGRYKHTFFSECPFVKLRIGFRKAHSWIVMIHMLLDSYVPTVVAYSHHGRQFA